MILRDHPLMTSEHKRIWPPCWIGSPDSTRTLRGELGILKLVIKDVTTDRRCFLFIEHRGQGYFGTLKFDDPGFCDFFSRALELHTGKLIKEIGELDLSYNPLDSGLF